MCFYVVIGNVIFYAGQRSSCQVQKLKFQIQSNMESQSVDSSPVHRSPNGDLNQNVVEVSHEKKKKKFKNRRHSAPGIFQSFVLMSKTFLIF